MRLAAYVTETGTSVGLVRDDDIVPVAAPAGLLALLQGHGCDFAAWRSAVEAGLGTAVPLASVRLAPPIARPGKIIGIGRNYGAHAAEGGMAGQEKPRIFFKPSGSISGPSASVRRPEAVRKLDFEGELVAVVGRRLSNATAEEAGAAIAGYMVGNDLSAREFQFDVDPPQTSFAKGMDGFAAIGPWMVTADMLGQAPDLAITTRVNGEEMQAARTSELIFPIIDCLAHISRYMTLEPGDILYTGTPSGVGVFRKPPVFLQPGDRVDVEIEGIGRLATRID